MLCGSHPKTPLAPEKRFVERVSPSLLALTLSFVQQLPAQNKPTVSGTYGKHPWRLREGSLDASTALNPLPKPPSGAVARVWNQQSQEVVVLDHSPTTHSLEISFLAERSPRRETRLRVTLATTELFGEPIRVA